MKRKRLWLCLSASLLLWGWFSMAAAQHPLLALPAYYEGQLGQGVVSPYMVAILGLNEMEHKRNYPEVKRFLQWYFDHLNYPDKHGLTGTVYDYVIAEGKEEPTGSYDSVDGYAGIFLHLLYKYVAATGDVAFLRENWKKVEDIAYLLAYLQDADGLTFALPDSRVKYLMDNCEVYGGVVAYLRLRQLVGKPDSSYYQAVRHGVAHGVLGTLYNSKEGLFFWAVQDGKTSASNWKTYYPDAYAQVLVVYYGLLDERLLQRKQVWRVFRENYGETIQAVPLEQRLMVELTKAKMARSGG